ncbi:MAG: class I SAM-dependent methyltransferase [Gammaproteobacteria bacterium]|nr:class I SAM-dependent methyltransferase [Gammaproteobacteria bacterium]
MSLAEKADRHDLYQRSVQGVEFELEFVQETFKALRGRWPHRLREDFCGTALSACEWVKLNPAHSAVAVDIDAEVLAWGEAHNVAEMSVDEQQRIELLSADVLTVETDRVDICQALNFSYWLFQERAQMKAYFQRVHSCLKKDGLFFLDSFGGFEAHQTQEEVRELEGFTYIWQQAEYNPVTADMQCYIHFEFEDGSRLNQAYAYRWRLWGAKEIRELLLECGFSKTRIYLQAFDPETDEPLDEFVESERCEDVACWIAYLVAEK